MTNLPAHIAHMLDEACWGDTEDQVYYEAKLRAILEAAYEVGEAQSANEVLRAVEKLTEAMSDA